MLSRGEIDGVVTLPHRSRTVGPRCAQTQQVGLTGQPTEARRYPRSVLCWCGSRAKIRSVRLPEPWSKEQPQLIGKEIAVAVLAAGSLLAQLELPGCDARSIPQSSTRDYSTPAGRLVGRWATLDPKTTGITCHYFGPVDQGTMSGAYITYLLEAADQKTGERTLIPPGSGTPPHSASWRQLEGRYQIADEVPNGDSVSVRIFDADGKPAPSETRDISCNGLSDSRQRVQIARYVDDKNLPCSEGDEHWKEDFLRFLAANIKVAPVYPRTGREVRYQVEGTGRASLTYRNASGGTDQMTVKLPWTLTFAGQQKQFVYLSAQNTDDWGKIEATIYLNDIPVQRAVSDSPYGIASVSGSIPPDR